MPRAINATPNEWIDRLGGTTIKTLENQAGHPFVVGHYSYPKRPELFRGPRMNTHYISVTLAGNSAVRGNINGEISEAKFRPGTCMLMTPNASNEWRWSQPIEEMHIFLPPAMMHQVARDAGSKRIEIKNKFAFFDETIWHFVQMLQSESRRAGQVDGPWLESSVRLLTLHLLKHYAETTPSRTCKGGLTPHQMAVVKSFVQENMHLTIKIEELSSAAGLSLSHFSREFQRETGQTPHNWITSYRIEQAKKMIAETDMPLVEIANATGFHSQSHFGSVFRQCIGKTPGSYRKIHRIN